MSRLGALVACVLLAACGPPPPPPAQGTAATSATAPRPPVTAPASDPRTHDLSIDESSGGHTLTKHVGRTDAQLLDRLHDEPGISAASTYTDRAAAERTVEAALRAGGRKLDAWRARSGSRPNLTLYYTSRDPIGRSIEHGTRVAVSCHRAIVVLRWDDRRRREFVLTSYPEFDR